jgi:ribokinase
MITVLGSLNLDLVARVPRFPLPGETLAATEFRTECGGKGGNQAVAAAKMGSSIHLIGAVGSDSFGETLLNSLSAYGVNTLHVRRRPEWSSGTAIILLDNSGQNQIVLAPGANASVSSADVLEAAEIIRSSKLVLSPLETPLAATRTAFQIAREAGVATILNPAPAQPLTDTDLQWCDWIVLNETEARILTGMEVSNPENAAQAAAALRHRARCTGVIVTLGAEGAWLETDQVQCLQPGFPVSVEDTVGAGDTFIGAFASALEHGASALDAVRVACAAAALSVMRRGAQAAAPNRAEVETFLAETSTSNGPR